MASILITASVAAGDEDGNSSPNQSSQGSIPCPTFQSSPLRKELSHGSQWTGDDLNKFGIKYDLKVSAPRKIFEMIQPHISRNISIPLVFDTDSRHITMTQTVFDEILDFDIDSFDLINIVELSLKRNLDKESRTIGGYIFSRIDSVKTNLQNKRCLAQLDTSRVEWLPIFERINTFLTTLQSILRKASSLDIEINEGTFVDLFQDFARIFLVQFKSAGIKRNFKMGGMDVVSVNGLRYDYDDHLYGSVELPTVVVTVAEVKKTAVRKRSPSGRILRASKMSKTEGRLDVGNTAVAAAADVRDGEDDDGDDVHFSSKLRGQLGIELLADVGRSCLKEVNNRRMILGLTVEVTLIRLTCLDIDMSKFKQMQEKLPEDNPSHVGAISYTRAYDMLKKDDRKELISILRYLLLLSNDSAATFWPRMP
ncbi:uncharacterized protein LOC135492483 [Lineus longissimus]|uniref:uncharacterized protein LOC135492483 n=1 Tax=Lineus longissimus TaxID=88925 RepID=UPI00315D5BB8